MNLRDLHYLVTVAEKRHFGQAAEHCHVSQPTLSTQLKKLEAELGVVLLERNSKSVTVTPLGKAVVARARAVLEQAEAIKEIARSARDPMAGPLALGIIPTLGPYLLPWMLEPLGRRFPALELSLHEDMTDHLLARLRAHELDAALLALPVADPDLEALPLFDEAFWVVYPPGHRFAGRKRVTEADLESEHLLLLAEGHCLRDQALALCGTGAATSGGLGNLQATSLETLRQMVAAGYGCTLVPALALAGRHGKAPLDAKPLAGDAAARRIALVYRKTFPRRATLEQLVAFIRGKLPDTVRPVA